MSKRTYTRAYATARFWAEDLDPLTITQSLLLPPDIQYRRGEPRLIRTKSGEIEQRSAYRFGMWAMSSESWVNSPRLHIHLVWLLDQLESHKSEIAKIIAQGASADFFCYSLGSTSSPPSIPRTVRARAESIGFRIEIDHYDQSDATIPK